MSDGMSDSRPFTTDREKWDAAGDQKLKRPIDVYFFHYRDGIQGECPLLDIEFFISRWGKVKVTLPSGEDAIAFPPTDDLEGTARKVMTEAIKLQFSMERHKKYLAEEGYL